MAWVIGGPALGFLGIAQQLISKDPNQHESSMIGCAVSFRVKDLFLKERNSDKLIKVVGKRRYDEATDVVTIEADEFRDRNHNAAYLGDVLEVLVREVEGPR